MVIRALQLLAALCFVGQWLYMVTVRVSDHTMMMLPILAAFLLLCTAVVKEVTIRGFAVILAGGVVNFLFGWLMETLETVPLYLDQIGAVIVALLIGPTAGVASSALGALMWSFVSPFALPYAAASAVAPFVAGIFKKMGGFFSIWAVIVSALLAGFAVGLVATPIRLVHNDSGQVGEVLWQAMVGTITADGWASDPIDKVVIFVVAYLVTPYIAKRLG